MGITNTSGNAPPSMMQRRVGLIAVIVVIGFYNLLFSFSFLPITEGWFSAYAHLILEGKVLYRDLYLYLTPFYPMALSAFVWVFGESFFMLRVIGFIIIIGISILLYLILSRHFSPISSMIASIVACIYYQSGVAHITYDFTQVLTLFTLLTTFMLIRAGEQIKFSELSGKNNLLYRRILLAGLFSSLAFMTKQSNGAFIVLAAVIGSAYLAISLGCSGWRLMGAFFLGALIPVVVVLTWLISENAFFAFWNQIFGGALAAKGSLPHVLFLWTEGLFTSVYIKQMATLCKWSVEIILISYVLKNAGKFIVVRHDVEKSKNFYLFGSATLFFATIFSTYKGFLDKYSLVTQLGIQANNYIIPIATTIAIVLMITAIVACFFKSLRKQLAIPFVILGIMSFGMICGNGTSAGLSEIGVFVMFSLAVAVMVDGKIFKPLGFPVALLIVLSLVSIYASRKFDIPYAWWGVSEPSVHKAETLSKVDIARGLLISKETSVNLDGLTDSLARGPKSGEIFSFPHIPQVYLIANRWPDSKVVVSWFDFLSDEHAKEEAVRILKRHPAVIVDLKLPPEAWLAHERLFRHGNLLGQRDIEASIVNLTEEKGLYNLDFYKEISQGCILQVWHLKNN